MQDETSKCDQPITILLSCTISNSSDRNEKRIATVHYFKYYY